MFEDPGLQDPLSLGLNENRCGQTARQQQEREAAGSPGYTCNTPEIQVIIKEEEDSWTVSENYESLGSEEGKNRNSPSAGFPHLMALGKESRAPYGVKAHQSEHPDQLDNQSPEPHDGEQRRTFTASNQKLCRSDGDEGENVCRCQNAREKPFCRLVRDVSQSSKPDMKSSLRTSEEEEGSTSSNATEELHRPEKSAPYQTYSSDPKMASARLNDRTLHFTVRLQTGPKEDEQEPAEEIGGLINSDGEEVTWDGRNVSDQESDCTEVSQSEKEVILVDSLNSRDCGSPTLIMEVVGDEEENEEEEQKEGSMRTTKISTSHPARTRRRRAKKVRGRPLANPDKAERVPFNCARRRVRRQVSQSPLLCEGHSETREGVSRRSRRRRNICTYAEPEEINSDTPLCVTAKQPLQKKDAKHSAEGENENVSTGKRRPRRKAPRVPIEIPPELLKQPREKIEYRCSVCSKQFPHAYKLERHELIHTGEKPYCCSICGRGFNQKGNLKTHYKVHLVRKDAVDFEDEVNLSSSELSEYLKSLPGESKIRSSLHCLECGKDCESQSALQAHHVTTHGEAESETAERGASRFLFCRRCCIQFDDKDKLETHMKSHVKEKRYSCPDCGKMFINESYIQIHQRIHTGERPFLCSLCGRGFHTASSLKLHEMQHSGERPYACSICGKTFQINSYLNAHYQTHIKDRPFVCSICGKGYSRAEELKVHHRLHTGERPYKCGECEKSFIYRQGLRQHQRTHAGRRMGPTRQLGRPKQQNKLEI
ncbi:zinc finger protein 37-like isoform X1 [Poecilia reticulata]|uniref:zinc finger protein 37-like isoform X1 n=2 Tax=Poecilia reticulata TaxID=8081 RepID=UPI0004A2F25E|nr:PREDICTED: zinc finger protein 37-like isoform X1 [Poecilia reticulata]